MIMEIVNIETSAFIEMNNALLKIETQLKSLETCKSGLNDWLDNQDVCTILDISERKLLSLRQKGMIPYSRIERKVYYKKDDIMDYMKRNIKTFINNNGNGTGCIE